MENFLLLILLEMSVERTQIHRIDKQVSGQTVLTVLSVFIDQTGL
jgi:hypothetical protein